MDASVQQFIQSKKIAVVGVSRKGGKFGNAIYTDLKKRGFQTFAVNPAASEIGGEKCYPNLAALQGQVDGVVVCVKPAQAEGVLREAAAAGLCNVWLQQGADFPQSGQVGKELGLNLVTGKCILMYAGEVGAPHSWHRFFAKLFGKY